MGRCEEHTASVIQTEKDVGTRYIEGGCILSVEKAGFFSQSVEVKIASFFEPHLYTGFPRD